MGIGKPLDFITKRCLRIFAVRASLFHSVFQRYRLRFPNLQVSF